MQRERVISRVYTFLNEEINMGNSGEFIDFITDDDLPETPERCSGCPNRYQLIKKSLDALLLRAEALRMAGQALDTEHTKRLAEGFVEMLSTVIGPPPEGLDAPGELVHSLTATLEGTLQDAEQIMRLIREQWTHLDDTCSGMQNVYIRNRRSNFGLGTSAIGQVCGHDLVCRGGGEDIVPLVLK